MPSIAAGYRSAAAGALTSVGAEGNYRSSSPYVFDGTYANRAGNLNFNASNVNPLNHSYRSHGFPVRCVQHLRELLLSFFGNRTLRQRQKTTFRYPEWRGPRFPPARS